MKRLVLMGLLLPALSVACGVDDSGLSAEIHTRSSQSSEALVGLVPVLNFDDVVDASFAERVVVDEIVIQVSDVRLLGLDPRIPTGGIRLIEDAQIVSLTREMQDQIEFAFPEHLRREDLAVYIRISPASELEGASVVVRGRLYATTAPDPDERRTHSLLADRSQGEGAVDPDGEPAAPTGEGAVDPDGEPAAPTGEGAVDPDGEPADCAPDQRCQGLSQETEETAHVSFELRGTDSVELQAGFELSESLQVVLGIPAARWFTEDAVRAMNAALLELTETTPGEVSGGEQMASGQAGHVVVLEDKVDHLKSSTPSGDCDDEPLPDGDYSLSARGGRGPSGTSGW